MKRFVASAFGLLLTLASPVQVHAQTYFGPDQFIIPTNAAATGGRAGVYPGTINVSGGPAKIQDITVTLTNMQHLAPSDFNVLLVGPLGQKVLLMRGCGGNQAISLTTISFNQNATASLTSGGKILPGTYKPTQFGIAPLPSPAPTTPYDTSLSIFNGTNANGNWSLYVWDSFNDAAGGAINGWQISFTGATQTAFTYQGVLEKNNTPVSGDANVRFTLHGGAVSSIADPPLAGPITKSLTGIEQGVFTTELDFGNAIQANRELWLGIEVESPPGSGYTAITPRTRLAIVPVAGRSLRADQADSLTNPPRVFSLANSTSNSNSFPLAAETLLPMTSTSFDFQAGTAIIDFTISGYTQTAQTGLQFRFKIGDTFSAPVKFYFNEALVHHAISGKLVINVPAGAQPTALYVSRIAGSGNFVFDGGDSVTYTILNLRQ